MTLRWTSTSQIINDVFYGSFAVNADLLLGLTFAYRAGSVTNAGQAVVPAGTILLTDNATNYVYLEAGSVVTATVIPSTDIRMLYEVITLTGAITTINDLRDVISIGN